MSALYLHLQKNIKNVFWFWELNHVIGFTYNAILDAAKVEADIVEVTAYRIAWFKTNQAIGNRDINSDVWKVDLLSSFRKISRRDKVVKNIIKILYISADSTTFEFVQNIDKS